MVGLLNCFPSALEWLDRLVREFLFDAFVDLISLNKYVVEVGKVWQRFYYVIYVLLVIYADLKIVQLWH